METYFGLIKTPQDALVIFEGKYTIPTIHLLIRIHFLFVGPHLSLAVFYGFVFYGGVMNSESTSSPLCYIHFDLLLHLTCPDTKTRK